MTGRHHRGSGSRGALLLLGAGLVAGYAGVSLWHQRDRNAVDRRPPDSAPGRTSRRSRGDDYAVTGRTVTIAAPRQEIYAFWRDFTNLPAFMRNVRDVTVAGDITRWVIPAPTGAVTVETRVVHDIEGEQIAWASTEESRIETRGKVRFRDAPAGRGTEVEALIAYVPPMGELGRWIAKTLGTEPAIQSRRDLKRLKMLFETGEIATNRNRKTD
ncbi:SRPBCC family protein [Wenxinia saemankumensis]|uniref:Polyketide cyclase / dehydrase and lipid transport n=1 Tax=Wenxinia saemankumensis TaxID=1447782 RepID=A0A1M6HTI6_9RHOB|nr:SRPBCC family protein [Wenxinia saemankumensis]SHJ25467.1 Polyketide cyclase / dehydrase and lipid transport [Wenxinia saemankumensis]